MGSQTGLKPVLTHVDILIQTLKLIFEKMSKKSKISKVLGRIWDGLGVILGWFGRIFGTISGRFCKIENLKV